MVVLPYSIWLLLGSLVTQVITALVSAGENETFVITGAIPGFTQNDVKDMIEDYAGKVTDSVSKNTSFVVVGDQPGSKLDKAKNLGIPFLDFDGLIKLIGEE